MGIYSFFEDKWYSLVEKLHLTGITDRVDKVFPSFLLFLIIIFILLFSFIFLISGDLFTIDQTYTAEITVLSKIGLPLEGVMVNLSGDCGDDIIEASGKTNDSGKVELDVCNTIQLVELSKTGYKQFRAEIDIEEENTFKLSLATLPQDDVTVLVKDEQNNILTNASLELSCDGNTTDQGNQTQNGFLVKIPSNCSITQFRASAPGYKEKTRTHVSGDSRVIINLEEEVTKGKVLFETKTPTVEEANVEIRITDSANKSITTMTDNSGVREVELESGNYSYTAFSTKGEIKNGNFTIFTGTTEDVTILFNDIVVESKKALYVKIIDELDAKITNAKVAIYKDGNAFATRNTNSLGEISPITIDPDSIPAETKFSAVVKAPGYETKLTDIEIVDKSGEPQTITLRKGGATLIIKHIDDVNGVVEDAFTTIYYSTFNEVFESGTSDKNGEVKIQNLPAGNYSIKSFYSDTDSEGEGTVTLSTDASAQITITLVTGLGKMKFNFLNQKGNDIDANYDFYESIDGQLQKTVSGESTRNYYTTNSIKSRTKVKLATTNTNFFPHETIIYKMNRSTQNKDVYLREFTSLPNTNEVQMFLVGIYENNPLTESFKSASRITTGETYYLYFDLILNNENIDTLLANFKIGNGNVLRNGISIENAYSIQGYLRVLTKESSGTIIDLASTNIVDSNAKQANVIFSEQQGKKSIPIFLEIKVDENALAQNSVPLYFQATHGNQESLLYTSNIVIGESICLFEYDSDCPAFLLSHYLKWNDNDYAPMEERDILLIGDEYKIKTTVKNLTDEAFGNVDLILNVPKEKLQYYTLGNDTNLVTHQVALSPLSTSAGKETTINPIKKTTSGKINLSIEKNVNGLNTLEDYELNEDEISIKVLDKEELNIEVIPSEIYQDAEYPFFYVKTKYKSGYSGVPAIWYVEKNGVPLGQGYEGMTDGNGIEITSFDATPFSEGDILTFVAEDMNGNIPARLVVIIKDPFPDAAPVVKSCLKLRLPNGKYTNDDDYTIGFDIPMITVNENASEHIFIDSNCTDDRSIYLYTDLFVSENYFDIKAGETKDITVTGKIRDSIYGAYPLQALEIGTSQYEEFASMDVVVNNSNGKLQLSNAILDFRLTNEVETVVTNTSNPGRKDNYYPQASLSTESASIEYNKPGNPESYTFTAKVIGHGLESIAYGFIKSDITYVGERAGEDSDPYNLIYTPTEAEVTETAADICEDVAYTGVSVPKPEPDLEEDESTTTQTYTPSSVVPISGSVGDVITEETTATTKAKEINKKISLDGVAGTSSSSVGTGTNATADETGEVGLGGIEGDWDEAETCAQPNTFYSGDGGTRGLNCGPYHPSGYYMEYIWDIMHDVQGNLTPGAPRPPNFAEYWGAVRDLRGQDYTVLTVNAQNTAQITNLSYVGDGITWARYYVKGSDNQSDWGYHRYRTSYLQTQIDYARIVEWASDQQEIWEAEVTIDPIEGRVYEVGSYDATPTPQWTEEDTVHGYEEGESWTPEGSTSLYTTACVVTNGFVDPERMSSLESTEPWVIRDPAEPYIEYSGSGNIMYEIPEDSVPAELDVYLRNGKYYAEYVGVSEIASKEITFKFSDKSLQGEEYAILKVRDWVNNSVVETAFQIKLVGNEHNCFTKDGTEGFTGSNYSPRLLFDWDWDSIALDQCDQENSNYTYCDGVQFNISIFKRLYEIEKLLKTAKFNDIANKTAFYAYLIKDNYSQELLQDFSDHYSGSFIEQDVTFDIFKKFIENNKLTYAVELETGLGTKLEYGGLYRIEIDIDRTNENLYSLFDGENLNADIQITLRPVNKASNYNPFYETPFDGDIGENRIGYGSSVDVNGLWLNEILVADNKGNSAMTQVEFEQTSNLATLDNEIVLQYDKNTGKLKFYPSQPTAVEATVTGSGNVKVNYTVDGSGSSQMPAKEWKITSSTIGTSKCHDFEDQEAGYAIETVNGDTHQLEWSGNKSGTLGLTTTYFTPEDSVLKITPTLGDLNFNSQSNLIISDSIILQYYDQQKTTDYVTLQGVFNMIAEEKLCMSKNSDSEITVFWNPYYIGELEQAVTTGSGSSCD